jgi:hypothetical protein
MGRTHSGLRTLGDAVRELEDAELACRPRVDVDERLARVRARTRRRERNSRVVRAAGRLGGVVVLGGVLLVALAVRRDAAPLRFAVGPTRTPGEIGAWVAAPSGASVPLEFSDGTRVEVAPDSRARVVAVANTGARVVLERGRLQASVVPRPANDWGVDVGPFHVQVKGTRFDASWDDAREVFTLVMWEGHTVVSAACLDGVREAFAGDTLRLVCPAADAGAPAPSAASRPDTIPPVEPEPSAVATAAPAPTTAAAPSAPPPVLTASVPAPAEADWRELLARDDATAALAAAERAGFARVCESAQVDALVALADAARLAPGALHADEAYDAYEAVRRRFAGTDAAARAAFELGRLAFDVRHDPTDARARFTDYLRERPSGPLAQEALGRRIEAAAAARDGAEAALDAAEYLRRFPEGPHAAFARRVAKP